MTRASLAGQVELFDAGDSGRPNREQLEPGALILHAFALDEAPALLNAIEVVSQTAPFRHLTTARGLRMSVAMTNCGDAGWLSDHGGYRYDAIDPETRCYPTTHRCPHPRYGSPENSPPVEAIRFAGNPAIDGSSIAGC